MIENASIANKNVKIFVQNNNKQEKNEKIKKSCNASAVLINFVANGRDFVLSTLPSKLRSAKSFIIQPADLIRKEPTRNIKRSKIFGIPSAAIQRDHRAGQATRKKPIG